MATKRNTKNSRSFVHPNGRPRTRRKGPWKIKCLGYGHGVHICLTVNTSGLEGYQSWALLFPTPEHCLHMAEWLKESARFLRKENKTRSAGGAS
jgi:hypothetical protein